jgi:flagellar hook-associated protein 2
MDRMRNAVMNTLNVGNDSTLDDMGDLGVWTGAATGASAFSQSAVDGKLVLDTAKLDAALDKDPTAVQRLLGGVTGVTGFSQVFTGAVDPYASAGGSLGQRIDSAGTELTRLDDSLKRLDDRLAMREESLRKMFANLEIALQKSQSQSAELLARLGSLSNNG